MLASTRHRAILALSASWLSSAVACTAQQPSPTPAPYDLVIRGAVLHDGGGGPGRRADLAVRGERIAKIGTLDAADPAMRGAAMLDAAGLVLAPGFVDVHAHADVDARNRPLATNFVAMGVTTLITGNCGSSVDDLAGHLARVERNGIAVNYGSLVGHGTVRGAVMGNAERAPTAEELDAMRARVRTAMAAGAFGLSTGLIYVPGTYAETAEITALAAVAGEFGGLYATHMRDEGKGVIASIEEALEIGARAGVHVHLSHLKASGKPSWGRSRDIAEALLAARRDGRRVTGDQYVYTASSTSIDVLFPSKALAIGRREFGEKLASDASFHAEMSAALEQTIDEQGFGDLGYCQVASAPGREEMQGLRIPDVAEKLFGARGRNEQVRAAIDLVVAAQGRRVSMVYHKMAEDDVEHILRLPFVAIASDAGIRARQTAERPHPRGAGNNARVLGRYVRERAVVPLELAIHKMTALPARTFGIADRGVVEEGAFADLVLFDAATVADAATYEEPLHAPRGIVHVLVNGRFVLRDGTAQDARPGRVLRFHEFRTGDGR